ncbi:MAG: 1-deoxy-D-xylulose-5-phosphate synthase [Clostridia bacterium]|nr:1-deoxy-D-xylulose-5-phosphate synthase [Clostridia bacterium]
MSILDSINSPEDVRKLDIGQLNILSGEIREFLIKNILVTGGHLASNLGVVELTLALHKVFDLSVDRLIFDVGHQSYVHKIITGRREAFSTLRKLGGLSGFPKPCESIYDAFGAGHASTSISAAAGIARARDLQGESYNVIAFIGDGALTGGMAFEALNDIGQRKSKMIIILNDNEMSIEKNVGGLSAHLGLLRYSQKYLNTKNAVAEYLDKKGKKGAVLAQWIKSAKDRFKFATMAAPYFESIGINYVGIIDGHNIEALTEIFERVKNVDEPVIIHTFTKKGLGYKKAEENPDKYHGVSPVLTAGAANEITYSEAFGEKFCSLASENNKITAITAAMASGCGLTKFGKSFPGRLFDVGIAEEHAVTMAAGMAAGGLVPVVCIYSTFLQRAYDQIIHDVCLQKLHVVFAIDRAGLVGEDGETHQGLFDLSYLTHIPNLTVLAPSCRDELLQMLDYAVNDCTGPVAVRYPKGIVSERRCSAFVPFEAEKIIPAGYISIITCGKMVDTALKAADLLKQKSIDCGVLNLRTVAPADISSIEEYCHSKHIFTLEDNYTTGGMGSIVAGIAAQKGVKCTRLGFPDEFIKHGGQNELYDIYSLTPDKIVQTIERIIK